MVGGDQMKDYHEVFGLGTTPPSAFTVLPIEDKTSASNIMTPGEQPDLRFAVTNTSGQPIKSTAKIALIHYGTRGITGDIWKPQVFKFEDLPSVPIQLDIPAGGTQVVEITPKLPETFGAYAFVFDLGSQGRAFALSVVRTFAPTPKRIQFPMQSLDATVGLPILKSLGVQAIRMEWAWVPTTSPGYAAKMADLDARLKALADNHITVLLVLYASAFDGDNAPLGQPRLDLDDHATMIKGSAMDIAVSPKCDADFQKWVGIISTKYGWPNGPLTAVELWNEPWEGASICGWGADMLRFRELYTAMAQGVEEGRRNGSQVLIVGTDSSTNTWDKFFSDGKDDYLKWLDAVTLHYQGLWSPSLYRAWRNRTGPNGRVKIWDTESWMANSEDRIVGLVAGDRAAGYDRAMGVFAGNVSKEVAGSVKLPDGTVRQVDMFFPWPPAAAVGATQHFLGQRRFNKLLFQNGLPWVMVFDGEDNNPEDGTVVVVGDLRESFDPDELLFHNVKGLAQLQNESKKEALYQQLADPGPGVDVNTLKGQLHGLDVLSGGSLTFPNPKGEFLLYDFYGNPVPTKKGNVTVPLDSHGFFLRGNGSPGSFDRLLQALAGARIAGYEPLNVAAHDLLKPVDQKPVLRLTLTNILNRPVSGTLQVSLGDTKLDVPAQVDVGPNETKDVLIPVTSGTPRPDNTYPLSFRFDGGADGYAVLKENMHVNVIAKRTITVDGNLDDWKGVLPQPIYADNNQGKNQTVEAWLPFKKFKSAQKPGFATGYLAYDDSNFYFAAKIADNTPSPGTIRFATRDDDAYFYPDVSYTVDHKPLHWPEGVRRYSYRKNPETPFGSFPNFDNVQIAFNVIPLVQKEDLLPSLPGVMPGFIPYRDTDYEYALNKVADAYGGGTEIWRCRVPGMPPKNFYPREPASPFDGAVKGQLVIKQDASTRIVEAAIPWSEIPLVKKALDENRTIKFSFRVNDDQGPSMELPDGRSVSKINTYAFHPDFIPHWANEIEFGFEK